MKHKHGRKAIARLNARRKDWDTHYNDRRGFKRPGGLSRRKTYARGRAGQPNNTWAA